MLQLRRLVGSLTDELRLANLRDNPGSSDFSQQLAFLATAIDNLQASVTNISVALSTTNSRVTEIERSLLAIDTDTQAGQSLAIASLQSDLSSVDSRVDALVSSVADIVSDYATDIELSALVTSFNNLSQSSSSRLNALEASSLSHASTISGLLSDVLSLKTQNSITFDSTSATLTIDGTVVVLPLSSYLLRNFFQYQSLTSSSLTIKRNDAAGLPLLTVVPLQSAFDALSASSSSTATQLSALSSTVGTISTDLSALESSALTIDSEDSAVATATSLTLRIDAVSYSLPLLSALTALTTRVSTLETTVVTLDSENAVTAIGTTEITLKVDGVSYRLPLSSFVYDNFIRFSSATADTLTVTLDPFSSAAVSYILNREPSAVISTQLRSRVALLESSAPTVSSVTAHIIDLTVDGTTYRVPLNTFVTDNFIMYKSHTSGLLTCALDPIVGTTTNFYVVTETSAVTTAHLRTRVGTLETTVVTLDTEDSVATLGTYGITLKVDGVSYTLPLLPWVQDNFIRYAPSSSSIFNFSRITSAGTTTSFEIPSLSYVDSADNVLLTEINKCPRMRTATSTDNSIQFTLIEDNAGYRMGVAARYDSSGLWLGVMDTGVAGSTNVGVLRFPQAAGVGNMLSSSSFPYTATTISTA